MKTFWMAAAAAGALGLAGCAGDISSDGMAASATSSGTMAAANMPAPPTDAAGYVAEAARSDMYEIQSSQLALTAATPGPVQDFARRMVRDHTMTTDMIKSALAGAGMPASPPPNLDARRAALLQQLQGPTGKTFERLYVQQQVTAHQEALALHQAHARSGDNPALRAVADKIVPHIQEHLAVIQRTYNAQGTAGG